MKTHDIPAPSVFGYVAAAASGPPGNNNRDANGNNGDDGQSIASRDPSYRYITVRETAETVGIFVLRIY